MAGRSALVLGAGGITGLAWEIGLLAGLFEAGIDLTTADVVIGTSAGSIAGAQILSGTPLEGFTTLARVLLVMLLPGDQQKSRARLGRAGSGIPSGCRP